MTDHSFRGRLLLLLGFGEPNAIGTRSLSNDDIRILQQHPATEERPLAGVREVILADLARRGDPRLAGLGLVSRDAVPEVGEERWGDVVGYCTVTSVAKERGNVITCHGHDGAAGGVFTPFQFNRAYPALRLERERPEWLFAARGPGF
jgi:hypothetical protein